MLSTCIAVRVVVDDDEPEPERRVDLLAHERVHREPRVADRLDLLAREFGQHVVVGDVDAELVAAAPAARVASQPTREALPGRVAARDPDVDEPAASSQIV